MNKSIFTLALSLAISTVSADDAIKPIDANLQFQCHRTLRAYVREINPDFLFLPDPKKKWKKATSSTKTVLKIEADNYIKIKTYDSYESHKVFCSYHKSTNTVISVGISSPTDTQSEPETSKKVEINKPKKSISRPEQQSEPKKTFKSPSLTQDAKIKAIDGNNASIFTDQETGCEYLNTGYSYLKTDNGYVKTGFHLTKRLSADGITGFGCKGVKAK